MKLFVIGATGGTGQEIVQQASSAQILNSPAEVAQVPLIWAAVTLASLAARIVTTEAAVKPQRPDHSQAYFSCGPGDGNRGCGRSHGLRKRPWGREGPVSSQMPHEPFCLNRATC